MKNYKKDIIQFFIWMRNGVAFCSSWLLILWLLYNHFFHIKTIATESLIKMMFFVTEAVFLFSIVFTGLVIKKWSFLRRLTCFVVLISVYECVAFYSLGFFVRKGSFAEWAGFIGIILLLYMSCIGIYQLYSKKHGELYTQALKKYQQERNRENGQ